MQALLGLCVLSLGNLALKTALPGSLVLYYKVLVTDDSTVLNYLELRHLRGGRSSVLQTSLVQIPSTGFESVASVGAAVFNSLESRESVQVEIPVLAEGEPFADNRSLEAVEAEPEEFLCLDQLVRELENNSLLFTFEGDPHQSPFPQRGLLRRISVNLYTKSLLHSCAVRIPPDFPLEGLDDPYTDLEF